MKFLGIDIGTTTISFSLISDREERPINTCTIPNDSFLPSDHAWEKTQDPERIFNRLKETLDKMLQEYEDISAIGLTGQMHGILYTDKRGRHVSPLYTWQDGRGNLPLGEGGSVCGLLWKKYGVRVYSGYGLATHLYMDKTGNLPSDAVKICTIMDYAGMRLAGREQPLVHAGNAAGFGLFDVRKRAFMREITEAEASAPDVLPEVTAGLRPLGEYRGIPVCTAIGDNQASFLGAVGNREGAVLLNMGTGGQISVRSDVCLDESGIETRPLTEDSYLLTGSSLCGGRAYAMLERFFREYADAVGMQITDHYRVMEMLAKDTADTGGLTVDTSFAGTREMPGRRGVISGISTENFRPSFLVRGVMEGMIRELYEMYNVMQTAAGLKGDKIILSGNGFRRNETLRKIASGMFSMPAQPALCEEEAACGAACAARDMARRIL